MEEKLILKQQPKFQLREFVRVKPNLFSLAKDTKVETLRAMEAYSEVVREVRETMEITSHGTYKCKYKIMGCPFVFEEEMLESQKEKEKFATKQILDEEEKAYLLGVIKPFAKEVKSIKLNVGTVYNYLVIIIFKNDLPLFLPSFENTKKMYQGMIPEKEYSLEELGLTEETKDDDKQ